MQALGIEKLGVIDLLMVSTSLQYAETVIEDGSSKALASRLLQQANSTIEMIDQGRTFHNKRLTISMYESINEGDVRFVMDQIDNTAVNQYEIPGTRFVADFYFPKKKVVLEINGPSHYIKRIVDGKIEVTNELNGRALQRDLRVRETGLKLVNISFKEFDQPRSKEQFVEFISTKIN